MATRYQMFQYVGNIVRIYDKPERTVNSIKWFDTVYVPERTCKPIDEYSCGVPSCGNCGATLNMETSGVRPFNKVLPNYCHNCGAKVISGKDTNVHTNAKVVR